MAAEINIPCKENTILMPTVFISYAHSNSNCNNTRIESLVERLNHYGIDVKYDANSLSFGDDLHYFMKTGILSCDYVLVLCSPEYKQKADSTDKSGVREETELIISEKDNVKYNKFIPVLFDGSREESIPTWADSLYYCDLASNYDVCNDPINMLVEEIKKDFGKRSFRTPKKTAGEIVGTWCDIESKRCFLEISIIESDIISATVSWSSSAFENTEWHMSGAWSVENQQMIYDDGERLNIVGNEYSTNRFKEYSKKRGAFILSNNSIYWFADDDSAHFRVFKHEPDM